MAGFSVTVENIDDPCWPFGAGPVDFDAYPGDPTGPGLVTPSDGAIFFRKALPPDAACAARLWPRAAYLEGSFACSQPWPSLTCVGPGAPSRNPAYPYGTFGAFMSAFNPDTGFGDEFLTSWASAGNGSTSCEPFDCSMIMHRSEVVDGVVVGYSVLLRVRL